MEEVFIKQTLTKIGFAILAIALVDLVFINYFILEKSNAQNGVSTESKLVRTTAPSVEPAASIFPSPSSEPQTTADDGTKTIIEKQTQTIVQTAQKEIFIPIGSGSTYSRDYVDLNGLEVTVDTGKYSEIESVVFEASVWVQDGNGKTYTQLYNITDKHPVWFSEISTNSASGVLTTSSKITLDKGVKTYRVQAKTDMDAYAAHVENARIKITLK